MLDFPSRLRELRNAKGISQTELGRLFSLSKQAISSYETGGSDPSQDTLQKLADYFGVSVDYLLGRTDDPSPTTATDTKTEEAERRIDEALAEDADPDTAELHAFWQELKKRPDLFLLFKQVRPMSNDSIRRAIRIIKAIEEEEQDEKNR